TGLVLLQCDSGPRLDCLLSLPLKIKNSLALFRESFGSESHGVCVEVTVPQDPVMQQRGSSVELPCHYKTSVDKNFVLEWKFAPGSTSPESGEQMLYFLDSVLYKPGSQEKRLSLLQDPPHAGGGIHQAGGLPPSTPVCKGTTSVSVGSDATLTCESSEGVPAPIYSWTHLDSKASLPLSNMVQNEKTGKLLLTNVSLAFSGTYRCVASNEFGKGSCQVSIQVTALTPNEYKEILALEPVLIYVLDVIGAWSDFNSGRKTEGGAQAGVVAGAVIGVLLALLLLSAIVIYILHFRKEKTKRKSMSIYSGNEIREDATAPGVPESSLLGGDGKAESHHSEKFSSRPESASTTKSQLNNMLV
ncbi:hypothetical protein lerEdw1_019820, partial [Lerista edwardsae]